MGETSLYPDWPRWLKGAKASEYAAMSPTKLKELALAGKIRGGPDEHDRRGPKGEGVWLFDRDSIDAYRERQLDSGKVDAAVERLLRRVG